MWKYRGQADTLSTLWAKGRETVLSSYGRHTSKCPAISLYRLENIGDRQTPCPHYGQKPGRQSSPVSQGSLPSVQKRVSCNICIYSLLNLIFDSWGCDSGRPLPLKRQADRPVPIRQAYTVSSYISRYTWKWTGRHLVFLMETQLPPCLLPTRQTKCLPVPYFFSSI